MTLIKLIVGSAKYVRKTAKQPAVKNGCLRAERDDPECFRCQFEKLKSSLKKGFVL
jgi:hypothetical protein